ncbi:50S ribosomal protein L32 [Candidatus Daviesbacteria bacterium RIFCSPHIGHO2_02_FULL_36_13]|uniref:Large ribosomal subunit protein bL32 n=1 Tax=Candidatus Daviesbacteria bacterium RIFCSPHIGHO2_02_FULL_36_13 TaxID=1797768 RepID=A0A1F5JQG5_9BACT|nr:MAG: 50S ribosomal protein L32 [Candidatus Daviesbacteria bacterium RIFCSPHIGHO2_02_FULL_36_13]
MAGEPKRRHSSGRKNTRRASIKLALNLTTCKNCGKPIRSHMVCPACGFYNQKLVKKESVKVTKADSPAQGA